MISAQNINDSVTITFTLTGVITWLIVGLIAGFLAGVIVRGRGFNMISSIIVGLIGAFVGGFLVTFFKITPPGWLSGKLEISVFDIVVSFVGAALVLIVLGVLFRRRA